ncbi:MAG: cysteine hydrolase [Bacteroidales bacterium]|nr:cysteine hydrolase [Bacteroidales bacterium]
MKRVFTILALVILFQGLSAQSEKSDKILMKPALLVIDVQKAFLPMMSQQDQDKAIEMMNWSMWLFRKHGLPVIRVYHKGEDYGVVPGTPGFEFSDSLKIEQTDPMVIKTYSSSFTKTELDKLLKEKGINTLFLCGLSSVGCVLATYIDAENYDYKAFLIEDALLSHDADYTNQIEKMFRALDLEAIDYMLKIRME